MEKNLRRTLIKILCILLAVLFTMVAILFYGSLQSAFLKHMAQTNDSLARQIAASCELVVSQIDAQIYRFASYDNGLLKSVQNRKQSVSAMIGLYKTLDSVAAGNRYLYSIYLYVPEEGRIFASDRGASYPEENFFDPAILPFLDSGQTSAVPPRSVAASTGQPKVLISTVFPLPGTNSGASNVLIANVDLELLYQDILKNIQVTDNQSVYIYDENGSVVACQNPEDMFSAIQKIREQDPDILPYWITVTLRRRAVMQSDSAAPRLGMNFFLRTSISIQLEHISSLPFWIFGFFILIIVGALLCCLVIRASTRPLQDVVFALNEKLLRDLLLDTSHGQNSALSQLERLDQKFEYERFLVALCETPGIDSDLFPTAKMVLDELYPDGKKKLSIRALPIKHSLSALIINYSGDPAHKQLHTYLSLLYQQLESRNSCLWMYSGLPRNSASQLPAAYQDCVFLQSHKLILGEHFAVMRELPPSNSPVEYPFELEKQLLNNLLIGNEEGCSIFLKKFLQLILDPQNGLSDIQIKNYLYQLQNAILKRTSLLPISIRLTDGSNLDDINTGDELQECFEAFIHIALEEINRKNAHNESRLLQSVFKYIDDNLLSENFNLNSISYHFNLNRNYLAELIREQSGYSFNDYINHKKVEMSKPLLADHSLTVEAIAYQCGFSYAHYYIKIFKTFEGVTPGQYRKTLEDNKNASLS